MSEIRVDTISEKTSTSGVTIDSLGIKDGKITNLMNATLSAAELGGGLHIKVDDSGASVAANYDEIVIENSDHAGMSILTGTDKVGAIRFGDSGDNDIGGLIYNHDDNSMTFKVNAAEVMKIDSTGAITKPLQPAFLVQKSANQNDVAIDTGVTITWDTERFDVNADFASNTFTAPVTGKYVFILNLYMSDFDGAANFFQVDFISSNRNMSRIDESSGTEDGYRGNMFTTLIDMDANDTTYVQVQQGSGTAQANITTSSYFSGYLAC